MREYRIDGADVTGIADLYAQFNRELMADEDWQLGPSLDALNDALHRVDSEIKRGRRVKFVWADHDNARAVLGLDETRRWLQDKLDRPEVFNTALIQEQFDALGDGTGKTYFELVLEVFADHPTIELDLR